MSAAVSECGLCHQQAVEKRYWRGVLVEIVCRACGAHPIDWMPDRVIKASR